MRMNGYQELAMTSQYKGDDAMVFSASGVPVSAEFAALSLAGEAGEIANLVKKAWRASGCVHPRPASGRRRDPLPPGHRTRIVEEMGDVLWYLAQLATILGVDLGSIAEGNLKKLGVEID